MSTIHRMSDAELPEVLTLLARSGGTARTPATWQADRMTALVLGPAGAAEAVMPMACRRIAAGLGCSLEAGWLSNNQFASRMGIRRRTLGTAGEWAGLLPELDALLVLRRDEPSLAARWYNRTGFADLLSIRCLYLEMNEPPALSATGGNAGRYQVQVITPSDGQWSADLWQSQMESVYRDVYAVAGGMPIRHPDFWRQTLANHYYKDHYQFQIIGLWSAAGSPAPDSPNASDARLMGYAVVGWSGWHSKRPRMDILELATRQWDTAVAEDLLRTTCQLAWSKNVRQVRAVISVHDPYRGHLARSGFADRWGYVMQVKWLAAQRYLDARSATLPKELGDFWVELEAPGQLPLVLGRGLRSAANTVTLRGEPAPLARLLLGRVDVTAALTDGTLQPTTPLTERDIAQLSHCFPWVPWVFHMLDYI
jgi:hypothetical protein